MKNVSSFAGSLLLASTLMSTASAADKAAPDLLTGIQGDEVQTLSEDEMADTRGEKITIRYVGRCGWRPCFKHKTIFKVSGGGRSRVGTHTVYVKH